MKLFKRIKALHPQATLAILRSNISSLESEIGKVNKTKAIAFSGYCDSKVYIRYVGILKELDNRMTDLLDQESKLLSQIYNLKME